MSPIAIAQAAEVDRAAAYVPLGVHLAGSIPLTSGADVFRAVSAAVGDRVRRIPDGETGARADWIVWQYPVLSAQPQFEVAPPSPDFYRALPRLKLREGEAGEDLGFGSLGYADAALGSYRTFAELKRAALVPSGCRFQVCLPTPLAPISAFVAPEDQERVEDVYARALSAEVEQLLAAIPHDQLAIQWDTNFEFGMLEGEIPAWFSDVKGGVLERLIGLSRLVPGEVELGFHFCYGDGKDVRRRPPRDMGRMVEIANALAASIGRPLNWIHMPAYGASDEPSFLAPLRELRVGSETELYLGVLHGDVPEDGVATRIALAHEHVGEFGVATACGWGRLGPARVPELLAAHARYSRAVARPRKSDYRFAWPEHVERIPDEDWVNAPVDSFGLQYDTVENHGWYRNLDPTVEQLAGTLSDGDVLIDYSGGTGILLNRLMLRIFDRQVGMMIVDSSPKFLRVALERFRNDERIAFRRLRFLKDEKRLQLLEEVVPNGFEADAIASTNAIHLYYDLEETLRSWARVLKPGGRVFVNSGNIRNPSARPNEWILDETVYVIHEVATGVVRSDVRWEAYRAALDDADRMAKHLEFRDRVFLAPRPLDYYLDALQNAGFELEDVSDRTIEADVQEWYEFLSAYHDAVLGWVGGTEKVDGVAPTEQAVADRLELMREALDVIFGGRDTFLACWTYIEAGAAGRV
jgi:ubiquinone/menaquinone biosynthesis C-methylase UbiE